MKVDQIREFSQEERLRKLDDLREEMFNLRFQHEIGQLENPKKIRETKADIARIKTVTRELELTGSTDKE
ncbi:MAG: 50S ribosomal protein L29 [Deltaproteobacteria bacterium]|nr:50S ribosomal protein L29 [Deltaproteobacteria bacterium]MBW2592260.1 50S ribosomal protein L29 [Deltaproteobacteria bacterium]